MFKRVVAFIKRIFGRGSRRRLPPDSDEAFRPIDVDEVKTELRLAHEAERLGRKDIPGPDDQTLDNPQLRIEQFVKDEIADAFRYANVRFEKLGQALSARSVAALIETAKRLPDEAAVELKRETQEAQDKIRRLERERSDMEKELNGYAERYGVERRPRLKAPHELKTVWIGILTVAIVQAMANAVFFAQGMQYGLSAGLVLAILLGVFDIFLHFTFGQLAVRLKAPDLGNRIIGTLFTLLTVLTVTAYNLSLVHLRNQIRFQGFEQGVENWAPSLLESPFSFTDFGSFALLVIGLFCSSLAVYGGWNRDEPIPLFRKLGHRIAQLEEEEEYWRRRLDMASTEIVGRCGDELDEVSRQIEHNVRMGETILARMRTLKENLLVFKQDAARAHRTLMQFYRDENRIARSAPPPPYFSEDPQIEIEVPLDLDLADEADFVNRQRELRRQFESNLDLYKRRLAKVGESRPDPASAV